MVCKAVVFIICLCCLRTTSSLNIIGARYISALAALKKLLRFLVRLPLFRPTSHTFQRKICLHYPSGVAVIQNHSPLSGHRPIPLNAHPVFISYSYKTSWLNFGEDKHVELGLYNDSTFRVIKWLSRKQSTLLRNELSNGVCLNAGVSQHLVLEMWLIILQLISVNILPSYFCFEAVIFLPEGLKNRWTSAAFWNLFWQAWPDAASWTWQVYLVVINHEM